MSRLQYRRINWDRTGLYEKKASFKSSQAEVVSGLRKKA